MKIEETRFEYFHETKSGFSGLFATAYKQFNPLQNIPPKDSFPVSSWQTLTNF
jgi:hypothetical protein